MPGVVVHSVYNHQTALGHRDLPHIVKGNFNGHNSSMGHNTAYENGEPVEQWAHSCDFTLIHGAKLLKSFNSARWKKGSYSYLILAPASIGNMCKKSIMAPIPHPNIGRSVLVSNQ